MDISLKGIFKHFLTWFVAGSGATLAYCLMTFLWKKFVG